MSDPHTSLEISGSLHMHPFSTVLVAFWLCIIAAIVVLLQISVDRATHNPHLPWLYSSDGLPNILLIVFAQVHGPLTAMHLARLAVSGVRSGRGAPLKWTELFLSADRSWAGPVGYFSAVVAMVKRKFLVSWTFVLFCAITGAALATPIVLGRAFPVSTLDVAVPQSFNPNTIDPALLSRIMVPEMMGIGSGPWATGQSVIALFNTTSYTRLSTERAYDDAIEELFFAGDVDGMDVQLPGVRLRGSCKPARDIEIGTRDEFKTFCNHTIAADAGQYGWLEMTLKTNATDDPLLVELGITSFNVAVGWCSGLNHDSNPYREDGDTSPWTNDVGFFWLDKVGVTQCQTNTLFGTALVSGRNLTFSNFTQGGEYLSLYEAHRHLVRPYTVLHNLLETLATGGGTAAPAIAALLRQLGYTRVSNPGTTDNRLDLVEPSLEDLAHALWRGVTHITNAVQVLSRSNTKSYIGVQHYTVSGRTRHIVYFCTFIALVFVWFAGMFGATAWMLRPSFCDSLNSYSVARLLVQRSDLIREQRFGTLDENKKLAQEPFGRVTFKRHDEVDDLEKGGFVDGNRTATAASSRVSA